MQHLARTLRRVSWILCACVLLLPRLAAAEPFIAVDFDLDGDGRSDQVVLDRDEPRLLHVWLSASGTSQVIRSRVEMLQVVAADLDGDASPELIARDRDSQLHVWQRKYKTFHSYARRSVASAPLEQRQCRSLENLEAAPPEEMSAGQDAPFALTLWASPRAPGLPSSTARVPATARAARSSTAVDPFAPRPPPARTPR
jgi:hypothetical protein